MTYKCDIDIIFTTYSWNVVNYMYVEDTRIFAYFRFRIIAKTLWNLQGFPSLDNYMRVYFM